MFNTKTEESTLSVNQQIGAVLREERLARGLSSAEISRDCKLQEVFVQAIEEGHTDYLPTHIYFRMFARLYADTLNIDPDQLLGKLFPELPLPEKPEFGGAAYNARPVEGEQPSARIGGHVLNQTVSSTSGPGSFDMSGLTSHSAQLALKKKRFMTRAGLIVAGVLALSLVAKYTVLNNGFAQEEQHPAVQTPLETSTEDATSESALPTYTPREQLELTIKAKPSAKNAAVVVIADGDTLFNRKMRGGEVYTWNSNYRFKVDIADKDQVEIFIGGQRLQTPENSGKHVAGLEITQLNYEELLATPLSATTAETTNK